MKKKDKNISKRILLVPLLVVTAIVVWFLVQRLEGSGPEITLKAFSGNIGLSHELSVQVADAKSGLRKVRVALLQGDKELVLLEKTYISGGFFGPGEEKTSDLARIINPKKLGVADGPAMLRIDAWDFSWRGWLRGNNAFVEKKVVIDTRPPSVEVISRAHNVTRGGAGLAVYKVSEECPENGVMVGDNFFPGHSGYFKDPSVMVCFFALNYEQRVGTSMAIRATDAAGNRTTSGFPHYIRKKRFRRDRINISDGFLNKKMPEFDVQMTANQPLIEKFLIINRDIREKNRLMMEKICATTDKIKHWRRSFKRFPNSATRAKFADLRDYYYKGKIIDQQRHLGIDLASLTQAPVPVANGGKVVFAGNMGIYGKIVVVDHGFSLFSTYAHLSYINVAEGQVLAQGDILGNTGMTGLAGGDHLHFAMFIHNTYVTPLEWWDGSWIKNNVTDKLKLAEERFPRADQ